MPTYFYGCRNHECGKTYEIKQSIHDAAFVNCPKCGEPSLQKLPSPAPPMVIDSTPDDYMERPKDTRPGALSVKYIEEVRKEVKEEKESLSNRILDFGKK